MNPWLIGFLVWLALLVLVWLFFTGVAILEALCAKWEEEQIRRIAASNRDERGLPANWRELDSHGSTLDAWAEMRRRKTGGA